MKKCIWLLLIFTLLNFFSVSAEEISQSLVENSSLDKNISLWWTEFERKLDWQEGGANNSFGCMKITTPKNGTGTIAYYSAKFVVGETYDLEYYVRTDNGDANCSSKIIFNDTEVFVVHTDIGVNNQWKKIKISFKVAPVSNLPDGTVLWGKWGFYVAVGSECSSYLDEVKLTSRNTIKLETYKDVVDKAKDLKESNFLDTENHWASSSIEALSKNGYLNGVDSTYFEPERSVTRAEFLNMILQYLKIQLNPYSGLYNDVKNKDWFSDIIQTSYDLGLIADTLAQNGNIQPDMPITRQEACSILDIAAKLKDISNKSQKNISFSDEEDIAGWAVDSIKNAVQLGFIYGFPNGSFQPNEIVTRAQGAEMLKRLIELNTRIAIYVDYESGDDSNQGTLNKPFRNLSAAQMEIRKYNANMKNHIFVFLKSGEHYMSSALALTCADSGTNGYNIIYTSYGGGKAVLTGGKHINGWSLYDNEKNIYKANVEPGTKSRQLFINGIKATRARSTGGLSNCTTDKGIFGHTTTDTFLADFKKPSDLEMVYYDRWFNSRFPVDSISAKDGKAYINMAQPAWSLITFNGRNANAPAYYENAFELLDEPGEWYLNSENGELFYIPRMFEDVSTIDAVLPIQEQLIKAEGKVDDKRDDTVHNLVFENLQFSYTTWLLPSNPKYGYGPTQAGYALSEKSGITNPTGAVEIFCGQYVSFEKCIFSKLGGAGLSLSGTVKNCDVSENLFYDIANTAFHMGFFNGVFKAINVSDPVDERCFVENNNVSNNYIHHIATESFSSTAMAIGFPKNTTIQNNEIFNTPYSGMHIGWGWDGYIKTATRNFKIQDNYIHLTMNSDTMDGGGIYTIGATGGTMDDPNIIKGNYIGEVVKPYAALYLDNGSTNWKVYDNVVDFSGAQNKNQNWLLSNTGTHCVEYENNYSTSNKSMIDHNNSIYNEPLYFPDAAWPQEALDIIENAGIRPAYIDLFNESLQFKVKSDYMVKTGDVYGLDVKAIGRYYKEKDFDKSKVYIRSDDSSVAEVDENNNIKAIKQGYSKLTVQILNGDILETYTVNVFVDDKLEDAQFNLPENEGIQLVKGFTLTLKYKPKYTFDFVHGLGETVTYTSDDRNVVVIDEKGVVSGVGEGNTKVKAVVADPQGNKVEKSFDITILDNKSVNTSYVLESSQIHSLKEEIADANNWVLNGGNLKNDGNSMTISTSQLPITYSNKKFSSEIFDFNITVGQKNGTYPGWPSISFRKPNVTDNYTMGSCYMVTFGDGYLDLQRFVNGNRTVIYGNVEGFKSLKGASVPCELAYGETANVQVGAVNEAGGVRIIVNINGKNIINYYDGDYERLNEPGYIDFYVTAGEMRVNAK